MSKKDLGVDEIAKRVLKRNPIYIPDEPAVIGNPDNLKKTDKEIEDEELGEEGSERQERSDSKS